MKARNWFSVIWAISLLAAIGCNKSNQPAGLSYEFCGIKIDLSKLDSEFVGASQEAQNHANNVKRLYRQENFAQAFSELGRLSKTPNLTPAQKRVVDDLVGPTLLLIAAQSPIPAR